MILGEPGAKPVAPPALPPLSPLPIPRHRHDIDGLRAIAVLAVVVNHLNEAWLPGGYRGVDMFFAISGFVITKSLIARDVTARGRFLLEFYARRIKRLLPALLVCVAATSILALLFTTNAEMQLSAGVRAVFGLSNLRFYQWQTDYFSQATRSILFIHTWSLGVEEQFYFFFSLLWVALDPRSRLFLPLIMLLSAVSLALYLVWAPSAAAFYLLPMRFWEIGAGCILAVIPPARPASSGPGWAAIVLIGVALLFELPFGGELLAVLATAALIRWPFSGGAVDRALGSAPMQTIGLGSYSLYLWHWPVIALANWTIGVRWQSLPLLLAATAGLAWASYRFIELPLRRAHWRPSAAGSIAVGGVAAILVAATSHELARFPAFALYSGQVAQLEQRGAESLMTSFSIPGLGSWDGERCVFGQESDRVHPIDLGACTFGHGPRVLVLGNSYATAFVRGFEPVARSGRSVTQLSSLGAAPVPILEAQGGAGALSGSALSWRKGNARLWGEAAPAAFAALRTGDTVLLISDMADRDPSQFSAFERGLRELSAEAKRHGAVLLVLDSLPYMRDAECKPEVGLRQWFAPFGSACHFHSRAETLARRAPLTTLFKRLEGEDVLRRIDLFDVFCPGLMCTFQAGQTVLYRDEYGHPSVEAMKLAGPLLQDAITGGSKR